MKIVINYEEVHILYREGKLKHFINFFLSLIFLIFLLIFDFAIYFLMDLGNMKLKNKVKS